MKKIAIILALVAASLTGLSQALPSGSVLFGQQSWLAPDGSVWIGKDGYGYKRVLVTTGTSFVQPVESTVLFQNGGTLRVPTPTSPAQAAPKGYVDSLSTVALSTGINPTTVTILNNRGSNAVIPAATSVQAGVMTANDKANLDALVAGGGSVDWDDVTGKPSTFPPSAHTHAAADVVSGTFNVARIPDLNASKITAGTFDAARVPDLNASKITAGTFDAARIPNLNASKITAGTLASARLPIASAGALGGIRVGSGLSINASGVLSTVQPEGNLSLIDEITWTEFATPNGDVHPLQVGYYTLTVSAAEESASGVKQGSYTMVVYDRQVGGTATGAGTVFLQHQSQAWCYNVYQDFGGSIRVEPLNSATTFRMYSGGTVVDGPEATIWSVPITGDPRYGNIFTRDGDRVEIEYIGSFPSSEDKTLRLRIGPTSSPDQVFGHTIPSAPATQWTLRVVVTRTSASVLAVEAYLKWGTSIEEMYQLFGPAEDTPFQTIRLTGQSASGIILQLARATYYPYLGPIDTSPL